MIHTLAQSLRQHKKGSIITMLLSILEVMFEILMMLSMVFAMLTMSSPVFTGLLHALITIGCVYLVGVLATLIYNRMMVTIAQSTLKRIRDEMFPKMQWLPIRYFDTHTHGETMSLYTNDTDTLRQLIAQSMAQLISSVFTIVAVFVCMLYISIPLTAVAVVVVALSLKLASGVMERIGGFFMRQQEARPM